jgi:hypothetical protein
MAGLSYMGIFITSPNSHGRRAIKWPTCRLWVVFRPACALHVTIKFDGYSRAQMPRTSGSSRLRLASPNLPMVKKYVIGFHIAGWGNPIRSLLDENLTS